MVGGSTPGSVPSSVSGLLSQPSLLYSTHTLDASLQVLPPMVPVCVDSGHGLHPFSGNRFDAGPVRLTSIVHAFSYRIAVLRAGAKPALRTGCSRKVEWGFLDNVSLPWGEQVVVMLQIVSALVLDVPAAVSVPVIPLIAQGLTFM